MSATEVAKDPFDPDRAPRRLLINDEGTSTLHFLDIQSPHLGWTYAGPGRDLQIIGGGRVLRSRPDGYVELAIADGQVVREVVVSGLGGGIESARRLPNGHTVVAGNGDGGIFLWEVDERGVANPERMRTFVGLDKVRLVRLTADGTFLFCSEVGGASTIHEADWSAGIRTLFEVPKDTVAADSMVKAVRVAPDTVLVSTGYAASLLRLDIAAKRVLTTIGGKAQDNIAGITRPLSPFFFSGFQLFEGGDVLVCNWQGHSAQNNQQGYQLIKYDGAGRVSWLFDQSAHPTISSLNNVIVLDDLDVTKLHDEPNGILVPIS